MKYAMKKVRKKWTKRCNRNSYTAYFFNVLSNPTLSPEGFFVAKMCFSPTFGLSPTSVARWESEPDRLRWRMKGGRRAVPRSTSDTRKCVDVGHRKRVPCCKKSIIFCKSCRKATLSLRGRLLSTSSVTA